MPARNRQERGAAPRDHACSFPSSGYRMHTGSPLLPARVALVTGGNKGIGRSIALHLATRGWDVILTYRSDPAAARSVAADIARQGRDVMTLALDVTDSGSFPACLAAMTGWLQSRGQGRKLDALINNAGAHAPAPFGAITADDIDLLHALHFKGPLLLTQALSPLLADGARIVNLSSSLTRHTAAGSLVYAAMKGALEVMTRYLALELGPRGITVNAVAPGPTQTDFFGGAVRDNPDVQRYVSDHTALGRPGNAEDIGAMVAALVGPDNHWVTAQRIEVGGGILL
jgi:NAD(P)-dependent dehydrogenase (short-subunit alcohol dehydrogenase family)